MDKPKTRRSDYSVPQAARELGCSSSTIRNRIRDERVKAFKIGGVGHWHISQKEIDRQRNNQSDDPFEKAL